MRNILVMGATGSVGQSALDVIARHPSHLRATGLTASRNAAALAAAALAHGARMVAIEEADGEAELRDRLSGRQVAIFAGPGAAVAAARESRAELAVAAIAGSAGVTPTLAAVLSGKDVALANKETLVIVGGWFMEEVKERGVRLLPVDSEHSGLYQCLRGRDPREVRRLVLTASGGPFRGWTRERVRAARAEDALRHPTWTMGRKVSVDSATLANKALEIIEAHWLFGLDFDRIEAIAHPQSLVHGWAEFTDGALLMHAAPPDMRIPLQYALLHPDNFEAASPAGRLAPEQLSSMTFEPLDTETFPLFGLGVACGRRGGAWPAAFSGANEAAVAALLSEKGTVGDLFDAVAVATAAGAQVGDQTLEGCLKAEAAARETATRIFGKNDSVEKNTVSC